MTFESQMSILVVCVCEREREREMMIIATVSKCLLEGFVGG